MFRFCVALSVLLLASAERDRHGKRSPSLRKDGLGNEEKHLGNGFTEQAAGPVKASSVAAAAKVEKTSAVDADNEKKSITEQVKAHPVLAAVAEQASAEAKGGAEPAPAAAAKSDGSKLPPIADAGTVAIGTIPSQVEAILTPMYTWKVRVSNLGRHLFAGLSVAVIVKAACMVGNLLVQVSPIPQVQDWDTKGTTGSADPAPYVSMALGGWQWCSYGFAAWLLSKNDGFLVLVYANCMGFVLGCYYTVVFWRLCRDNGVGQNLRQYLCAVGTLLLGQLIMWTTMSHARALFLHSFIAGACSFVSAFSLLMGLPVVLRTGDTSAICGPLVLANFGGAFLWAYWGWLMNDTVIIAANMFAAFSSSMCLYIKYMYNAQKSKQIESPMGGIRMGNAWSTFATRKAQQYVDGEEWRPLVPMKSSTMAL